MKNIFGYLRKNKKRVFWFCIKLILIVVGIIAIILLLRGTAIGIYEYTLRNYMGT